MILRVHFYVRVALRIRHRHEKWSDQGMLRVSLVIRNFLHHVYAAREIREVCPASSIRDSVDLWAELIARL